jgi:hypothetical protein
MDMDTSRLLSAIRVTSSPQRRWCTSVIERVLTPLFQTGREHQCRRCGRNKEKSYEIDKFSRSLRRGCGSISRR